MLASPSFLATALLALAAMTDALPVDAAQDWRALPVPATNPNPNAVKRGTARGQSVNQEQAQKRWIKNPKVVPNPKNPFYSSSLAAMMDPTTTTSAAATSTTRPATTEAVVLPPATTEWHSTTTTTAKPKTTTRAVTTTTRAAAAKTTSVATTTTSSTASAAPTSPAAHIYTGGIATFFWQNGNAGNCGWYESDSTYLVALPTATYDGGKYCGQYVMITRTDTGDSIKALVADSCPTCENDSCLDLSWGAFSALGGTEDMGIFDISWYFLPSS
ncbi:hypothetical protein JCM8202_004424 [Rhodotorula sphaerocarpa]